MRSLSRSIVVPAAVAISLLGSSSGSVQASNPDPAAQWFPDAGFGLFVHWGLASVKGVNISWTMRPGQVLTKTRISDAAERARIVAEKDYDLKGRPAMSANEYWAQAQTFNPQSYDPDKWLAAAR